MMLSCEKVNTLVYSQDVILLVNSAEKENTSILPLQRGSKWM